MSIGEDFDNEDREMMRQALASYSPQERVTLRRFVGTLLVHPVMCEERILRLILDLSGGAPVKRKARNLRLVAPLRDESPDG